MADICFKSSLSTEEIENNFKDIDLFSGIVEGLGEALAYEIGADYMRTLNETIIKVATSPGKSLTKAEAKSILRNCGIFNKDNKIKSAYKNIVFETDRTTSKNISKTK